MYWRWYSGHLLQSRSQFTVYKIKCYTQLLRTLAQHQDTRDTVTSTAKDFKRQITIVIVSASVESLGKNVRVWQINDSSARLNQAQERTGRVDEAMWCSACYVKIKNIKIKYPAKQCSQQRRQVGVANWEVRLCLIILSFWDSSTSSWYILQDINVFFVVVLFPFPSLFILMHHMTCKVLIYMSL